MLPIGRISGYNHIPIRQVGDIVGRQPASKVDTAHFPYHNTKAFNFKTNANRAVCKILNSNTMEFSNSEFHNFSLLPTELRLQIWTMAIPRRILKIECEKEIISPTTHRFVKAWDTHLPHPSLLTVNRESRSIALQHYAP
jgi:hypothetical protein